MRAIVAPRRHVPRETSLRPRSTSVTSTPASNRRSPHEHLSRRAAVPTRSAHPRGRCRLRCGLGAVAGLALTPMNGAQHLIWHGPRAPYDLPPPSCSAVSSSCCCGARITTSTPSTPSSPKPRIPSPCTGGARSICAPSVSWRRFRRRRRPGGWAHRRRHRTVDDPRAPHHLDAGATRRRDTRRRRHRLSVAGARATLTGHPQATHERPRRTSRPGADEFSASCRGLRASAGANAEPSR